MSQAGYLYAGFACVVVVIVGWLAIILGKHARIRREAAELETDARGG
jgi:hypothetical protein